MASAVVKSPGAAVNVVSLPSDATSMGMRLPPRVAPAVACVCRGAPGGAGAAAARQPDAHRAQRRRRHQLLRAQAKGAAHGVRRIIV